MHACLLHPEHGYYNKRDPFGRGGDFVTAPEVSQMFGELIGLALAQAWLDQAAPAPFILAELGPGRGTLMADILRATRAVPGFNVAATVHLVEASPLLRDRQSQAVPGATFHDTVESLPDAPLFLVANEFFDALPVRQFVRADEGWRERMVGFGDGMLRVGLSEAAPLSALQSRLADTTEGQVVETCPALPGVVATISQRIAMHGGFALIIDYGDWVSLGDTLQAVADHNTTDPFAAPGTADLTAHVDFAAIAAASVGAAHSRLTPQGVFLERLGITARARALAAKLERTALENHVAAHRRLTHPNEMGDLFKVLGITPTAAPAPPGLTA